MNRRIALPLFTVIGFAALMAVTGVAVEPGKVWPQVLLSGVFLGGIGLGAAFLVAVHDVSSGRWLGPLRRIACSFTSLVLPGSALVLVAVIFGGSELYPAFHEELHGFKALWLSRGFFTARSIAYVLAWTGAIALLRRRRGAAPFLVVFGITVWLSSVDWIMSLEPHWGSTMFGVYRFAGLFPAALAVVVITAVHRARTDRSVTEDHLHDLGKLLFAFSTFWMYIWFSQAMLVWYANLHEETGYFVLRTAGNWGLLFWLVVALMWVVPFLVLLPERAKKDPTILSRVAMVVLAGHWLDLYVAVVPPAMPQPALTGWDLALAMGSFACVGWAATRRERGEPTRIAPEDAVLEPERIRV